MVVTVFDFFWFACCYFIVILLVFRRFRARFPPFSRAIFGLFLRDFFTQICAKTKRCAPATKRLSRCRACNPRCRRPPLPHRGSKKIPLCVQCSVGGGGGAPSVAGGLIFSPRLPRSRGCRQPAVRHPLVGIVLRRQTLHAGDWGPLGGLRAGRFGLGKALPLRSRVFAHLIQEVKVVRRSSQPLYVVVVRRASCG